jgi:hypothetical protein
MRARWVARLLEPDDADALVEAAYLHDIGYAPALAKSGLHPLDGARYLRARGAGRLASLVAHHGAADEEAALRGLADELAEFRPDRGDAASLLDYCDLTIGPTGESMTLEERLTDVEARYGATDVVTVALREAHPRLERALATVEERLRAARAP